MSRRQAFRVALIGAIAILTSGAEGVQPKSEAIVAGAPAVGVTLLPAPAQFTRMPSTYHPPYYDPGKYRFCRAAALAAVPPTGFGGPFTDYVSGFANAAKAGNAAVAGYPTLALIKGDPPSEGYIAVGVPSSQGPGGHDYVCAIALGQLDYLGRRQVPPITATFLGFGFEPVDATVILKQYGSAPFSLVAYQDQGRPSPKGQGFHDSAPIELVGTARLQMYLQNVSVNGVHLDVGGSCRSSGPLETPDNGIDSGAVVLAGGNFPDDPEPVASVDRGGALAGLVTIPPFANCVTPSGENLDALLTAAVSGPRNYIQVDAGPPCARVAYNDCSATDIPTQTPDYTITHGGSFTASSSPFEVIASVPPYYTITCTSSTISGMFPDAAGPAPGALASMRWIKISGCTDGSGQKYAITSHSSAYSSGFLVYPQPGTVQGVVDRISLNITGPGGCSALLSGYVVATYFNKGSVLEVDPYKGLLSNPLGISQPPGSTPCRELPDTTQADGWVEYTATGTYDLGPVHPVFTPCPANRPCSG